MTGTAENGAAEFGKNLQLGRQHHFHHQPPVESASSLRERRVNRNGERKIEAVVKNGILAGKDKLLANGLQPNIPNGAARASWHHLHRKRV